MSGPPSIDRAGTAAPLMARNPAGGTPTADRWGVDSEHGRLRDVLLGPVETFGPMENAAYSSVVRESERRGLIWNKQTAVRQHREMVDAYVDAGVVVHTLPADEGLEYAVYARDSSFMTPFGAVVCQLANPRRRGEYAHALRFYLSQGIPIYDLVTAGNFEGGDFNIIEPGAVLVGHTGLRCEEVAARQVGGWMEAEGWEVKHAAIDGFYVHIDLMVCMLAKRCAAVCLETVPDDVLDWLRAKRVEIVPVGFKETMNLGCNVMALGDDRVLSSASATDLNARLRAMGFKVYDPDMSMFAPRGGGIHCLAQPLRRDPG